MHPAVVPHELTFQHSQRLGPLRLLLRRRFVHGRRFFRFGPADGEQFRKRRLRFLPKIHILVAPQRVRQVAVGQQQRDEATVYIGGVAMDGGAPLQRHPARGERIRRDAQQQHPGLFQPLIHLQRDDVSRADVPFIEPHPQSRLLQPFRKHSHARLVLRVVAEENVVLEFAGHGNSLLPEIVRQRFEMPGAL